MQAANQSVVTQDGELLAVNGKLLSANYGAGGAVPLRSASVVSVTTVCSCTCYPRQRHFCPDPRNRYFYYVFLIGVFNEIIYRKCF